MFAIRPAGCRSVRPLAIAVMIAVLAGLTLSADAQQRRAQEQQRDTGASDSKQRIIDLNFEGGTVRDYVNALAEQTDAVNVLLDPLVERFPVTAVKLRSVDITSAIYLLDDRSASVDGRGVELMVSEFGPFTDSSLPVYSIQALAGNRPSKTAQISTVLSVKDVLSADFSTDDVLTAVETAIGLIDESDSAAEIRFHEQTGLLIARGTSRQMSTVHEVIAQLREGIERARSENAAQQELMQLRDEMRQLQAAGEQRHAKISRLQTELVEARTRAEMFQQELDQTRTRLQEREHRISELLEKLSEVRSAYNRLQSQLQQPNPGGNP